MNSTVEALVAYVASPHAGYLKLFREYRGGELYILGPEFIAERKTLLRHLPGNDPADARTMIDSLGIFAKVSVLAKADIPKLPLRLVLPDEDVSQWFAEQYLAHRVVRFDGRWKLRWDWGASQKNERPEERVVSHEEFDREIMRRLDRESARSPDWWRQVGAALVRDGKILIACFNTHVPSDQVAYLLGDPRSSFEQGASIEVSVASHSERQVQAIAAREGIATRGCDLYVTTFPCPPCAYAWVESGIRRLYYRDGYSNLEAAPALKSRGIEIVRVE